MGGVRNVGGEGMEGFFLKNVEQHNLISFIQSQVVCEIKEVQCYQIPRLCIFVLGALVQYLCTYLRKPGPYVSQGLPYRIISAFRLMEDSHVLTSILVSLGLRIIRGSSKPRPQQIHLGSIVFKILYIEMCSSF